MNAALLTSLCGLLCSQVTGQEPQDFRADRMRPAMNRAGIIDVEWGAIDPSSTFEVGFLLKYANDPVTLIRTDGSGERAASVVSDIINADLLFSVPLTTWFELGVSTRVRFFQSRPDTITVAGFQTRLVPLDTFGLGDIRFDPKLGVLNTEDHGVDLAILLAFTVPTGGSDNYLGEPSPTFRPEVALSRSWGGFRLATNLSLVLRDRSQWLSLVVDDEVVFRLGAGYRFFETSAHPLEIDVSISGATLVADPFANESQTPLEVLGLARADVAQGIQVSLGGGIGILEGFGNPDFRIFMGARYAHGDPDKDDDGIIDSKDGCVTEPEDKDGFEDSDGCPELDNDDDGVPDARDGAPNDPEDHDGWNDNDGVPDPDNDGDEVLDAQDKCPIDPGPKRLEGCPEHDSDVDGIPDKQDACPEKPEDMDGYLDADGCPDNDNDGDGVVDAADRCPNKKGPQLNQGCPEPDTDKDGIVDRLDNCPKEAGSKDNQGCKDKQLVTISDERIEILEKVFFKTGSAVIQSRSFKLLDNVAAVLLAHPEIGRIRIEGHTDSRGSARSNKRLSQRRAASVRSYLIKKAVLADRLEAVGFGEDDPVAPNNTKAGRAKNRRVEFRIFR